jgi:hypothetical protein
MDGIFPALLQEGQAVLTPYLVKIFRACLATGYVPAIWRQVKVVFISKPSSNSHGGSKDFRNIKRRYERLPKRLARTFCSSVNDLPRSARLHRALSRDPKIRLGSLVAPSGGHTQSEGETSDVLIATHFPNSVVVEGGAVLAAACHAKCLDWWVTARIVTYRRVRWVIHSFAPYKSPGMDEIFPALLQEGREMLMPYLVRILCACLATRYVPAMWHQVKVKAGRNSYCGPRDFRPISLISFLLKTMERLVARFSRDEILAVKPLHPNHHVYQAGKSVETALHQLMVRVEEALDQQEIASGIFLDIEGAFNYTSYNSMCAALARRGVDYTIVRWIRATLEGRLATATLGGFSRNITVSRGCPQGMSFHLSFGALLSINC